MNDLLQETIRRTEHGAIDVQYYQEVARELRADALTSYYLSVKKSLATVASWEKGRLSEVIKSHGAHTNCEP